MTDDREPARSDRDPRGRIVLTATEARGAEVILGKRGRWIWISAFVLMIVLFVAVASWG